FEGRLGYASPGDDPRKTWEWHPISEKGGWHRYSHGLGAGDVDGDGRNDFLMPEGWWKQPEKLGGVTTWTHHPFRFGEGGATIWTDDVNGDGARDVITSLRGHGYGLSWFEQVRRDDGVATFQEHRIMASDPKEAKGEPCFSQLHAVELADIDGDGLQDIVTGKCYWAHNGADPGARDPAVLYWFKLERKDGKARYVPHEIDNDSGTGRQVTVIDLDGDGKLDVICGNKKGVFVFHQRDPAATAKRAE
ncbi:MAG TPA: VCBS repeat-containing protein, partial [Planctomycetota bacterium]|nr:VCBS repeat-containing protein [Planctomycetota bacterium]